MSNTLQAFDKITQNVNMDAVGTARVIASCVGILSIDRVWLVL